jgi:hypothetical protein
VREQIRTVIGLYRDFTPVYEGEFGDRRVMEYTALVEGRPLTGVGTFHLNDRGEVDEVVVNHRPLSAALTVSRLLGRSLPGDRDRDEFYRPQDQTYEEMLAFSDKHGREL